MLSPSASHWTFTLGEPANKPNSYRGEALDDAHFFFHLYNFLGISVTSHTDYNFCSHLEAAGRQTASFTSFTRAFKVNLTSSNVDTIDQSEQDRGVCTRISVTVTS